MWNDFKEFLKRGNMLDLAIGVIIGAAFGKIVTSLVEGILTPVISLFTGGIDFKQKVWNLGKMPVSTPAEIEAAQKAKEPLILYGQFINDLINFVIIAFVVFLIARWTVRFFKGLEAKAVPGAEEKLLTEIRDILKSK
jgi:large conductance mechanosensitive channel